MNGPCRGGLLVNVTPGDSLRPVFFLAIVIAFVVPFGWLRSLMQIYDFLGNFGKKNPVKFRLSSGTGQIEMI